MTYTDKTKQREYQLQWLQKRRQNWIDSQGGCCKICGSTEDLEIDHIDPTTKTMQPRNIWSRRQEVREVELAKCQVLCQDCHTVKSKTDKARVERGERNSMAKLTEEQVKEIRVRYKNGEKGADLAKEFQVNKTAISKISSRQRWSHI